MLVSEIREQVRVLVEEKCTLCCRSLHENLESHRKRDEFVRQPVSRRTFARASNPVSADSSACWAAHAAAFMICRGDWSQALASRMRFIGVSVARRKCVNPASSNTLRSLVSPACAPSPRPTSCDKEFGVRSQTMLCRTAWPSDWPPYLSTVSRARTVRRAALFRPAPDAHAHVAQRQPDHPCRGDNRRSRSNRIARHNWSQRRLRIEPGQRRRLRSPADVTSRWTVRGSRTRRTSSWDTRLPSRRARHRVHSRRQQLCHPP